MIMISGAHKALAKAINSIMSKYDNVYSFDSEHGALYNADFLQNLIAQYNPDIFINCMEFSDIDEAEYSCEQAYKINSFAVKDIADICLKRNIYLIHISSSYIFNGKNNVPYKEEDVPEPISVYGDSKLLGEKYLIESGCKYLIMRISDIYGEEAPFFSQFFLKKTDDLSIDVIQGQCISPSYTMDIAHALLNLIKNRAEGLFHYNQSGFTDVLNFLKTFLNLYNKQSSKSIDCNIVELDIKDFIAPADRPLYNVLDNRKYIQYTGDQVRGWEHALEDFIKTNGDAVLL